MLCVLISSLLNFLSHIHVEEHRGCFQSRTYYPHGSKFDSLDGCNKWLVRISMERSCHSSSPNSGIVLM